MQIEWSSYKRSFSVDHITLDISHLWMFRLIVENRVNCCRKFMIFGVKGGKWPDFLRLQWIIFCQPVAYDCLSHCYQMPAAIINGDEMMTNCFALLKHRFAFYWSAIESKKNSEFWPCFAMIFATVWNVSAHRVTQKRLVIAWLLIGISTHAKHWSDSQESFCKINKTLKLVTLVIENKLFSSDTSFLSIFISW